MSDKPKDMVVLLRQMSSSSGKILTELPKWLQKELTDSKGQLWYTVLGQAADELESMQKLNGYLWKKMYGD